MSSDSTIAELDHHLRDARQAMSAVERATADLAAALDLVHAALDDYRDRNDEGEG